MRMWLRQATLTLGSNQYTLDGLNFSFKVQFEDRAKVSTAQLEVYNLSPSTRASLKKGDAVIITAGYKGDVGCIFVGAIADYSHQHENLDIITKITAADCLEEWLGTYVNKTYKAGMYAKDIVDDLLNIFGVEVSKCELTTDVSYPRGRVCRGNLKQVLTEIVVNECKSRFIIRTTGQIYITKADDGIDNGLTLTPANGLLRADEEKVQIPVETDLNSQTTGEDRDEDTISRSCLLNYRVATAEVIKIQSADLNGRFIVVEGKHSGGRTSDWETSMELRPY